MYNQGYTNPVAFDISPTGSHGSRSPRGSRSPDVRSPGGRSPGARSPVVQLGPAQPARSDEEKKEAASMLMWSLNAWYNQHKSDPKVGAKRKLRRLKTVQAQEDGGEWDNSLSLDQPSYGTIFLQIKEANTETADSYEFIRKAGSIIGNTLFITVILGLLLVLPVGMISIGVKHLHDCPKERNIPIYLLVGGCFGFLKVISLLWKQMRNRRYERLDEIYEPDEESGDNIMSNSSNFSDLLLSLFLSVWFGFGNYWVLPIWKPHFEPVLHEPSNWCDQTVYMFAFIQIMIGYGLMGLILLLMIILSICHRFTSEKT